MKEVQELSKRWNQKDYINNSTYKKIYPTVASVPNAFGFVKIHKQCYPIRPVVTSIGSADYNLGKFLNETLRKLMDQNYRYSIKDNIEAVKRIKENKLQTNDCLLSLDVSNMYQTIPHQLIIRAIENMYDPGKIDIHTYLSPKKLFAQIISDKQKNKQ